MYNDAFHVVSRSIYTFGDCIYSHRAIAVGHDDRLMQTLSDPSLSLSTPATDSGITVPPGHAARVALTERRVLDTSSSAICRHSHSAEFNFLPDTHRYSLPACLAISQQWLITVGVLIALCWLAPAEGHILISVTVQSVICAVLQMSFSLPHRQTASQPANTLVMFSLFSPIAKQQRLPDRITDLLDVETGSQRAGGREISSDRCRGSWLGPPAARDTATAGYRAIDAAPIAVLYKHHS